MDFADQTIQPVKTFQQVLGPDGKLPKNARVEGTFFRQIFVRWKNVQKLLITFLKRISIRNRSI